LTPITIEHETPAESAVRHIERVLRVDEQPNEVRTRLLRSLPPRPEPEQNNEHQRPAAPKEEMLEKVDHTYLPLDALEEVSRALMHGAAKGDAWRWQITPIKWTERLAKAQRHILEFQKGIDIDPSSGRQHLACAISQLMFLQSYVLTGSGTDDRFKR
jgi:Domain of unknown function (DUF5664)